MGREASEGTADAALVAMLKQGGSGYQWVAATQSSMSAAPLQLAAGEPVMALGDFSSGDPAITLAQFTADVAARKVHYYLGGGGGPGGRGPSLRSLHGGAGVHGEDGRERHGLRPQLAGVVRRSRTVRREDSAGSERSSISQA